MNDIFVNALTVPVSIMTLQLFAERRAYNPVVCQRAAPTTKRHMIDIGGIYILVWLLKYKDSKFKKV